MNDKKMTEEEWEEMKAAEEEEVDEMEEKTELITLFVVDNLSIIALDVYPPSSGSGAGSTVLIRNVGGEPMYESSRVFFSMIPILFNNGKPMRKDHFLDYGSASDFLRKTMNKELLEIQKQNEKLNREITKNRERETRIRRTIKWFYE